MDKKQDLMSLLTLESEPYDDVDRDIDEYRTDGFLKRHTKHVASDVPRMHEYLFIMAAYENFKSEGFTLADLYHYSYLMAEKWDKLFELEKPYSILTSFFTRYHNIYSLNAFMTYWVKLDDCPLYKTGNRVISVNAAIPGSNAIEYRLHDDWLVESTIQDLIREPLVIIIQKVHQRTKTKRRQI